MAEEARQDEADDRHARDQQARRRAGQMAFGVREREPGDEDLDAREGQHGQPVGTDGAEQAAAAQREGEQEGGAQGTAREHHHGR
ncbi:hypothetical protein PV333_19550 [Streptomyces sp. NY05-11A]|nr:hypothetical protein [Streptomyces sp. NY05-11A]MDX2678529.1 hypothetical protein [Streptomyces sp. NY05-11A]